MSNNGEFSLEQSEELIAHLKSGAPSEFEQLRSTLSLLAHVPELPPTSIPPVLPSGISQPVPLLPVKSTKPRRTIVTSVIVTGMFASASLAAAAVTGIGPTPIVNIGHQTAKFVKGVAGAVSHVVTGSNTDTVENQSVVPQVPNLTPSLTGNEDSSKNNEESDSEILRLPIPPLLNPLTPEAKKSNNGKSNENEGSKTPHDVQSPHPEDSPRAIISPLTIVSGEKEHTESESQKTPDPSITLKLPSVLPSSDSSDQSSDDD